MPWYGGPALLAYLEEVDVEDERVAKPFRMPVQWINRPHLDFRGYSGTIAGGAVRRRRYGPGRRIEPHRAGRAHRHGVGRSRQRAQSGDAVTLVLDRELDIARGDVLADPAQSAAGRRPDHRAPDLDARGEPVSRPVLSDEDRHAADHRDRDGAEASARRQHARKHAARTLSLNQVGFCNLSTATPIVFDPYAENRDTGAFILIDRYSNATVAAGIDLVRAAPRLDHSAAGRPP